MVQTTVKESEILEVWESFSGWYWFVTERHENSIAFGLVRGWFTEWGYFDLKELRRLRRSLKVWKVPRDHWALCPCVVEDDAASCSRVDSPKRRTSERRWHRQWHRNN